jgi:hypothetical protein
MAFFICNAAKIDGCDLLYQDFLTRYNWMLKERGWQKRKTKTNTTIGRMYYASPSAGERFYLRLLLTFTALAYSRSRSLSTLDV